MGQWMSPRLGCSEAAGDIWDMVQVVVTSRRVTMGEGLGFHSR